MADVIPYGTAEDQRDLIHHAVQSLTNGQIVGLPLESGYVAATHAVIPEAVARLAELSDRVTLMPRSPHDALDFLPQLGRSPAKLVMRGWPGPIILEFPASTTSCGVGAALPESVLTLGGDPIAFRVSSATIPAEIGRYVPGPLAVSREFVTVEELFSTLGTEPGLIIDNGPVEFPRGATTIKVSENEWSVVSEGAVTPRNVKRMTNEGIVFVCTGNTCRSPMAEALCREILAKRLDVPPDELADHGFFVASAGVATGYGSPASPESVMLMRGEGIDLTGHESQPLSERLLNHADFVYTMTRGHRSAVVAHRPDLENRVQVLSRDGSDIPDPIGGGMDEYELCRDTIREHLQAVLSELPLPT